MSHAEMYFSLPNEEVVFQCRQEIKQEHFSFVEAMKIYSGTERTDDSSRFHQEHQLYADTAMPSQPSGLIDKNAAENHIRSGAASSIKSSFKLGGWLHTSASRSLFSGYRKCHQYAGEIVRGLRQIRFLIFYLLLAAGGPFDDDATVPPGCTDVSVTRHIS